MVELRRRCAIVMACFFGLICYTRVGFVGKCRVSGNSCLLACEGYEPPTCKEPWPEGLPQQSRSSSSSSPGYREQVRLPAPDGAPLFKGLVRGVGKKTAMLGLRQTRNKSPMQGLRTEITPSP